MKTSLNAVACVVAAASVLVSPAFAQDKPVTIVPLKVDVTIARYQGDKLIGSMPYSLTVNANDAPGVRTSLRMGAEVPVSSPTLTDGKQTLSYSYRSIGTNIDCSARSNADGRYVLSLSLEESAVYGEGQSVQQSTVVRTDRPAFRSFKSTNSLILRNGESTEYTTATDRVTGEVVKVTVKLTALN